ncbi:MAG: DUF1501 domain-containing protein [Verrucomicrobiae bacterium]|nr:DUF1501 domain-containing protein [Verrucomicrobiae bacterium]
MHPFDSSPNPDLLSRRWFLKDCGIGLGSMALASLLKEDARALSAESDPLAPRTPHFAPKAKRVIFLFQAGAPSHLDLFDNKPALTKYDGTLPPPELLEGYRAAFINPNSALMGTRFKFARHGQSGAELSELLPHLAGVADDLCIIKSMATDQFNHAPAQILMNTGHHLFGRPSMGAWSLYGLGSESRNLPGFVVFSTGTKGTSGGAGNWGSGFLPSTYQGVMFRNTGDPILYLSNPPGADRKLQRDTLDTLNQLNRGRFAKVGDPEIAARVNAYEMAFRMQSSAPELMDISGEPQHVLDLYGAGPGKGPYANACLLARRMIERGVRFVQIFHEAWDQHGNLTKDLTKNCKATDQPTAALIADLKNRGLLEDTLVIWGGEFGRTPMVQGGTNDGRDHHPNAFTLFLAGGGVNAGTTLGESDEFGFNVVRDRVHVHDLHATLLHLLGFDHTQLNHRFQGLDMRLTGVAGELVKKIYS